MTYQFLVHSELFALLAELSDDLLNVLNIHLLINFAHDVIDPFHRAHHLCVDLEGTQSHRDCTELSLHLIHALHLISDPHKIFSHGFCRTMLVFSGESLNVLQAFALLFCKVFLFTLDVTDCFVNYTLISSSLLLW